MRKTARLSSPEISLPEDILIDVLSRLPVKSLGRFKCISKYWLGLIFSPHFIKQQLHHASSRILFTTASDPELNFVSLEYNNSNAVTDYKVSVSPKLKLVGSCNGLVCLSDYESYVVLCNPATKESIDIPFGLVEPNLKVDFHQLSDLDLGHDPLTDTYKVVRLDITFPKSPNYDPTREGSCQVYVLTVGTKEWRKFETPFPLCKNYDKCSMPCVNGAMHWFRAKDKSKRELVSTKIDFNFITSFDIAVEEFREVPLMRNSTGDSASMGVLKECLCVYDYYDNDESLFDIWLMKQYGVSESWTKVYTVKFAVASPGCLEPFVVQQNGQLLLRHSTRSRLYAYNPEIRSVNEFVDGVINWINAVTYVESLVLIPSFIGEDANAGVNSMTRNSQQVQNPSGL